MKSMPAGQFKAKCLRVMEEVKKYRTPVLITKKGRPVARLVPAEGPSPDVFGCMAGTARLGDVEAPVVPATAWDATRSPVRPARRGGRRSRRTR